MLSVISCGMPSGLATSIAAPISEMLRIVQSILARSNSIDPALNTRCRNTVRRSFMPQGFKLEVLERGERRYQNVLESETIR
jgi:hypothetical protein